jgi:hypothetical protein
MQGQEIYRLIRFEKPAVAFTEILNILQLISPSFDNSCFERDFRIAERLYHGDYPGYRACNTDYHNFSHAYHTCLATARLIHGAVLDGATLSPRAISLTLSTAIYHDSGYLQEDDDLDGTGAKYTMEHIQRGIALFRKLALSFDYSPDELDTVETLIHCTDLGRSYASIPFPSCEIELLGKLLDTADLSAQTADRAYLERLLLLFYEFREAGIVAYENEADILRKTGNFYALIDQRLADTAEMSDRFMRNHFLAIHNLDVNPYQESINRQKAYLQAILEAECEPQNFLRREGIVDKVRQRNSP